MEEKDKVRVNLYPLFQVREAVGRLQMFFKLGVLKSFADFKGKHLCAGVRTSATLLKRDSIHTGFAKFLRTHFSTEHLRWLLLKSKKFSTFNAFQYNHVACLKPGALEIIQISFSSNGDWKESICQQNVSTSTSLRKANGSLI